MVGGLPYSLTLCKNARIMLIKNLDVSDGLVNGATGKILDIIHSESSSSFPKAIVIQFDNRKIGRIAIDNHQKYHYKAMNVESLFFQLK